MNKFPINQCYGHIRPSEYEVVKENVNQLLGAQVIRKCSSPFAFPIVLVKKKSVALYQLLAFSCIRVTFLDSVQMLNFHLLDLLHCLFNQGWLKMFLEDLRGKRDTTYAVVLVYWLRLSHVNSQFFFFFLN